MEFLYHLQASKTNDQILKPLPFHRGKITLSIQAGKYMHSLPENETNLLKVTHFELGVKGVRLEQLEQFISMEETDICIYEYVPKEVVEEVYQFLQKTYAPIPFQATKKSHVSIPIRKKSILDFIKRSVTQKVLITAMVRTSNDVVYEMLSEKLEKTIDFTETY